MRIFWVLSSRNKLCCLTTDCNFPQKMSVLTEDPIYDGIGAYHSDGRKTFAPVALGSTIARCGEISLCFSSSCFALAA